MKMAWQVYPGTYSDARGTEHIIVFNDGDVLETVIRGVRFRGRDFDSLQPVGTVPPSGRGQFVLNKDELCGCTIACDVPQVIEGSQKSQYIATMHVDLRLGMPDARGGIDAEDLKLTFSCNERIYSSRGTGGLFESELLDLKRQLPPGHRMMNCFGCAYSDYFYAGQGLFGSMACFRDCKSEYLSVKTKDDYIKLFDKNAGSVQETSICPQYAPRTPKTGYRG